MDDSNLNCIPLHCCILYELEEKIKLFNLSHDLIEKFPTNPISWFVIATYYLLLGKNADARRFYSKASTLDSTFGPAWLGFAHSFAFEGEHDQAISAYSTASRLFSG